VREERDRGEGIERGSERGGIKDGEEKLWGRNRGSGGVDNGRKGGGNGEGESVAKKVEGLVRAGGKGFTRGRGRKRVGGKEGKERSRVVDSVDWAGRKGGEGEKENTGRMAWISWGW